MTDEQRLIVSLEARINSLEKGLAKARKTTDNAMDRIERRGRRAGLSLERDFERATRGIESQFRRLNATLGRVGAVTGIGAGLLGGAGLAQGVRSAVQQVRDLAAAAETAGVAFEKFQGLRLIARDQNVKIDALTDGLKELQLRADEFVETGKGPAAEAFRRLGFSAQTLASALREPDQLFLQIIERARELDSAAQIRVFDEIFGGTGGEQLLRLLGLSREEMERIVQAARDSGKILSEDVAQDAEDLAVKFDALATTIETRFQQAVVAVAEAIGLIGSRTEEEIAAAKARLDELKDDPTWNQVFGLEDAVGRAVGGAGFEGAGASEAAEEAMPDEERIRRLRDLIDRLTRQIEEADNRIALAEADGAADRVKLLRDYAAELAVKLANARAELQAMRSGGPIVPAGTSGRAMGGEPPAGTGSAYTLAFGGDARQYIRDRAAHGNVDVGGLSVAAAQGAAAVLAQFPELQVSSAYRSPAHNDRVGGATNSRHLTGDALDFVGFGSPEQAVAAMRMLAGAGFRGFGMYGNGSFHADRRDDWAFWGPDYTSGSLGQTPGAFQAFAEEMSGRATEAEAEAQQRSNAAMREAAALRERNATALERYVQGLQKASELLQRGMISQRDYNREVARLQEAYRAATEGAEQVPEQVEEVASASSSAAQTIGSSLVDTLLAIAEDSDNAERALKRLAMQMARMALMGAIGQGPLAGLFGGGLGGGASASAGGNVVGAGGPVPLRKYARGGVARSPHVALFGEGSKPEAFVPLPDGRTIPVTLRAPREPAPMGGRAGGGSQVVNVIDQRSAGAPVERRERRGPNGLQEIDLIIRDAVEDEIERSIAEGGRAGRAMEQTYGLRRRLP